MSIARLPSLSLICVAWMLVMTGVGDAATHYREEFSSDEGDVLPDVDWDDTCMGANGNTSGVAANDAGGTYLWWYNATGLDENSPTTAAVTTKNFVATPTKSPDLAFH